MQGLRPHPASPEVLGKIEWKHRIRWAEVVEALSRHPHIQGGVIDRYGERRYGVLGRTAAGRHLFIVCTLPGSGLAKVITARDMTSAERSAFRRFRRGRR